MKMLYAASLPLLLIVEACSHSPERRLEAAMAEKCRQAVTNRGGASVPDAPRAALMRDDWVQVDGVVEWRGESGQVSRNAWTCDMFRGGDGVWRRRYLSFGPV